MIHKLKGRIDEIGEDSLVIDVSGVGYGVFVSSSTIADLYPLLNKEVTLFIETHVREDHIHLYGFLNKEDKSTFNMLQTVSGIGAKVALNISLASKPKPYPGCN
jgi:Holliday junction DNA helicase RuvA